MVRTLSDLPNGSLATSRATVASVDAQERMILALAQKAHEELVRTGWAGFFEEGFAKTAEEVGASEQDVRQARRLMLDGYLLVEKQPGSFTGAATSSSEARGDGR